MDLAESLQPKLTPEQLSERMKEMRLKNEQIVAKKLRSQADENQYKEQQEARELAHQEHRMKMKQKREDDNRIQSVLEY